MMRKNVFLLLTVVCLAFVPAAAQDGGAPPNRAPRVISGGVVNGKATNLVKPPYPAAARAVRAEGAVNVQVTIDEEGNIISASAVSGHPLLRSAAVAAARASKFSPTRLEGQPVKVTGVIVYNFALPKEESVRESEKLIPMGIVMFLTAMKEMEGDEESREILRELGDELPASMKADKSQFERLSRATTPAEKERLVDEIVASLRKDLTGTDAWMVDLGKQWGNAIGEAFRLSDGEYRGNRQNFIKGLQGMNWLLESPPKDISEKTLAKIRAIASYDNETDSITPEFVRNFFKASLNFIEYMINDGKSEPS